MSELKRTFRYLRPYTREAVLAIIFLGLVVVLDLSIPRMVQTLVDEGIGNQDMDIVLRTSLMMIGASILSATMMIGNTIFSVKASRGFEADLREDIFKKIQTYSFGNLDDLSSGQLLTRLTSDLNQIRTMMTMTLRMFTRAPLMAIISLSIMWTTNPQLTKYILILMPVTGVFITLFIRKLQPLFTKTQEKLEQLNQVLEENLSGIRIVKAFVRRDYEGTRFKSANKELTDISVRVNQLIGVLFPLTLLIMNTGIVAIIYFGGIQVIQGSTTVGTIIAFTNYVFSAMFPIMMLSMMAGQISFAEASAKRIMEVLDNEPEIKEKLDAVQLAEVKGRVEFKNVSFSYREDGGDPVLHNVNFTAEPGETVAILGSTGSGKSSLIHLIPRFYDVSDGKVLIDGYDVRDVELKSIRKHIGISLQEAILFSGTIRDNIRYGRPEATDEEVIEAAKAAQAHEFIIGFPEGYDTNVGQRGVNLSGGQKQRIAIARALLVKPSILILDDSTSAVDVETEIKIEEALEELMKNRTSFIIAQRISTVLNADKIIVLDDGNIAAEGTHDQLIQTSPIYKEIYDSQLGDGGAQ
ncbi:MAG TPA: ABC transporter ATP-binding protein [Candidatus Bathyarchaeota archaeon]|nr:ABC transporter ATP-binding protein [Candidatus Bathyarchaeota archaeon]